MLWVTIALGTVVALLPIANPFSTSAVFLGLTSNHTPEQRADEARRACIYMFSILVAFLILGTVIMEFFGISIPGLRIAGGLMIARIALGMFRAPAPKVDDAEKKEAVAKDDIAFTPLAMPSLSGPGAIAVTISMATEVTHWTHYLAIIAGLAIVATICWVTLGAATRVVKFLGVSGMNALTKIMGFLLLCVGVQFIVNGVIGIITEEAFLEALIRAYQNATINAGEAVDA